MQRRTFLAATLAAASGRAASPRIDRSRISAISDEIARSPEDAIAFAKQYKIEWLALRPVPGAQTPYWALPPPEPPPPPPPFQDRALRIPLLPPPPPHFRPPPTPHP